MNVCVLPCCMFLCNHHRIFILMYLVFLRMLALLYLCNFFVIFFCCFTFTSFSSSFFFFNETPTTEIYTYCHPLSLHDALPYFHAPRHSIKKTVTRAALAPPEMKSERHFNAPGPAPPNRPARSRGIWPLTPLPDSLPLLCKSVYALGHIVGHHVLRHRLARIIVGIGQIHAVLSLHHALAHAHRKRRSEEPTSELQSLM